MARQYYNFVFTSFSEEKPKFDNTLMKYLCFGEEKTNEGKLHWQGYCELITKRVLNVCKKLIGGNPHIEQRKGSQAQAIKYCQKDGKFEEFGEKRCQGEQTGLSTLKDMIIDGKSNSKEIAMEHSDLYHKYGRTIERIQELHNNSIKRDFETKIYWIWGKCWFW